MSAWNSDRVPSRPAPRDDQRPSGLVAWLAFAWLALGIYLLGLVLGWWM